MKTVVLRAAGFPTVLYVGWLAVKLWYELWQYLGSLLAPSIM